MMTQAYHEGGDFDSPYRSSHRSMPNHYYDRNTPYTYYPYHHRRSNRSEYPGRHSTRALIHEAELGLPNGQAPRKRIGVACTRCRKRKIKCTGDVGDGSGCAACKAQGGDSMPCTFNRVGSNLIPQYEEYLADPHSPVPQNVTYSLDPITSTMNGPTTDHSLNHRQSLPILQTRATYPESYDSYSASPIDGYPYSSYIVPRNDSLNSAYDNGYRSWSNANALAPALAPAVYDQSPGYTFGSISAPSFPGQAQQQQQNPRFPSVTSESFSPLNMGNLYTSLPTQTVQSRRLPIPQTTPSYEQASSSGPELPEIRPLAEPKTRLSSVHSRIGAPWPGDAGYSDSRNGSSLSLAPSNGMALSSMMQEPIVDYQCSANDTPIHPATQSSSASPVAGPSSSTSYAKGPIYSMPMTPVSYGTYYGLPPIAMAHRSESSASRALNVPPMISYSFNSDSTTAASSDRGSSDASSTAMPSTYASYPTIRHPQPQHAASTEALRRQASFDHHHHQQQQQQHHNHNHHAAPTQRISVSNLSSGGPPYSAS